MQYEMSHGDAVMELKKITNTREKKLEALDVIFSGELKFDYNCLKKKDLWELTRFLYKEIKRG